ncbi:MAG TPA: di-heme enzyme [Povalibacter sp.]|nr:di-heme enzyme [Povalibacter sp.]
MFLVLFATIAAVLAGCSGGDTPYVWNLPQGFPQPRVPPDNPLTVEKVALGRRLFHDTNLSANRTQACASCHQQAHAFAEPAMTATGSTGQHHRRNTMALVNVAYASTLTWAHPGLTTLEQQMLIPMFGDQPVEMGIGGHEAEVLARLRADAEYRRLFARAFPHERDPISLQNTVRAIASFVRTLISFGSPFDRYAYHGDDSALTAAQVRGLNLFMSERLECSHCHSGFNFSQFVTHESTVAAEKPFHVTGLQYPADSVAAIDRGVFDVTADPHDRDRFKAPTLRNIERSAPYMHDGSLATLNDVIDFYAAGGRNVESGDLRGDGRLHPDKSPFIRGFTLTAEEKSDLLAFLASLTDEQFLTNPDFGPAPATRE